MSTRRSGAGTGCGLAGVGCFLLVGFAGLSGVLICGGVGQGIWARIPRVIEVAPPRFVPGTDPAQPAPEPAPVKPRPRRVRPPPRPVPPAPEFENPDDPPFIAVEADTLIVAEVTVSGDAAEVVALGADGTAFPLPSSLPRGTYDLQVRFDGGEPFIAGSIAVLDGADRSVTCRESLGICKVR